MRFARRVFAWLFLAICVAGAGAYLYLRGSLAAVSGEFKLRGIGKPIEVLRDPNGIPHIFAASIEDAHFALGFVHAQDRLWQMEMNRRIGAGRLAEILGPGALETDRLLRTLGVRRVAEANLKHYDAESRRLLDAYSAGVNAFLASDPVLPPEFWILEARPERWKPVDSVTWLKMMAWDLGGNWRSELLRLQLATRMATSRIQEFLPPYPGDAPIPLPDLKDFYKILEKQEAQIANDSSGSDPEFEKEPEGIGSNSWVLDGSRTASGKPLLANDPHLRLSAPSVWYFAHLHAPGLDVIGGTLPGVPGVLIGRTDRIAWGFTNTGPDVQDLYLEKLDSTGGYVTPQGAQPFTVIDEVIKVKGGEDELLKVRISCHGPVISDVSRRALDATPRGYALALAWTALAEDDLTLQAALKLSQVHDWPSFVEVGRNLHTPQQNVTYADADGNIGFIAPGRVPLRKPENDLKGLAPAPGWDARYDWAGYIPYEALPRVFNPAGGAIVTANQKIVPPDYPHFITSEWQPPFRARRISQLLDAVARHDSKTFARMQADALSLAAVELLPYLKKTRGKSETAKKALQMISAWDGTMAADRAEPLIVVAWWRELGRAVYADELGDAFRTSWSPRALFLLNVLTTDSDWCDDIRTKHVETCDEIL